jgi:hypothetical protein
VYDVPPGPYQITASAPSRGIAVTTVTAPQQADVALALSGTGRIAGTVTDLGTGTFEAGFEACNDAHDSNGRAMTVAHEPRLVHVVGGRFEIEDAPACDLVLVARWRSQVVRTRVAVVAGKTVHADLDLGPLHKKQVTGVVFDRAGSPVAHVRVTATAQGRTTATTTDDGGNYSLDTVGGAKLVAGDGDHAGTALASHANVAVEQIDLRVQ